MNRFLGLVLLLICSALQAQVKLPRLVGDSMVLQRNQAINIWGWASPGETVRLSFQNKTYSTVTDDDKKWKISLPAMKAGGPYDMTIKASNEIVIKNILIGDVWLCSGQSNMEFPMVRIREKYAKEVASAANTYIRHFKVKQQYSFSPLEDVEGKWKAANPLNVQEFTAVGYFFARALYEKYKIPIGLIHSSWGGTPAEAWTSEEGLKEFPNYLAKAKLFQHPAYLDSIRLHDRNLSEQWMQQIAKTDKGLQDSIKWNNGLLDTKNWKELTVPGFWEEQGGGEIDGVVWARKEIDIPAELAGKEGYLQLGLVDDIDTTYFNDVKVGSTPNRYVPRQYNIPASLIKAGKNIITVRIIDRDNKGGFARNKSYRLTIGGKAFDLSGTWKYRVGTSVKPFPGSSLTTIAYQPTAMYNGMLAPLIPYTIKGVIWYQGEANSGKAIEYRKLLPAMINDWRTRWQQGDFPFLMVQLASYMQVKDEPSESNWALLRESQSIMASSVANSGMSVTIDIGEAEDVHPSNKKDVGERLALIAEKVVYKEKQGVFEGPVYHSMKKDGNKIVLSFTSVGSGLVSKGSDTLKQFAIAGEDRNFVWASAKIIHGTPADNDKVIVWNDNIAQPVAVRYAWADNPAGCNLYNKEGLPAAPFRTDTWERAKEKADSNFHVYLLIGQSNMAGRAPLDSLSKITDARIVMLDKNNNWVPATDPVHFDKPAVAGVGPAISFAKAMLGDDKNIKIGLIPCAWGGSPIRVWEPDSAYLTGHPYDDAIGRTKAAMQKGVLKGILWHQGESDNNPQSAEVYIGKLQILIDRLRTTFNLPALPFVAGEIGEFGKEQLINKVIDELPAKVAQTAVVSSEGLIDKGDKTHFDAPSARELGRRYAEAMKQLQR